MEKAWRWLLASVLVLCFSIGIGISAEAAEKEKLLRVGTEPTFAPFEFEENGQYVGFDMELIRAAGKEAGYKVEIVNMGFDALIPALKANNIDVAAAGMTINEERKKEVAFTKGYYTSGLIIMVRKDNEAIRSIKDLEGKTIAVQIGTSGEKKARSVANAKVVTFNTNSDAAMEVMNRGADAVINDSPVVGYYLAKEGKDKAKTVGQVMEAEEYGFAAKKGNEKLAAELDKAIETLKKNGEYDKIYEKWFGESAHKADAEKQGPIGFIIGILPLLLAGAAVTVEVSLMSVAFGLLIGLIMGVMRISENKLLRGLAACYIDFIRGTPLLVQIFIIYFALPQLVGHRIDPYVAGITACSINSGAYLGEIFRAGIQSIDKGQMEAGRSLGLSWAQTMQYIIIPQAFKRIVPPLGNEFIAMLKDSSLVSVIGFEELTRRGQLIIARTYASLEVWLAVAIIYLIMTLAVSRLVAYLERRLETK